MQMVKIRIWDGEDRSKSVVELAKRGRIICLPDDEFVVPEPALQLLASLNVSYDELGRGGFGYAGKTLSDSLAVKASGGRELARKEPDAGALRLLGLAAGR